MKKIAAYLTGCVLAFCLASCGIESVSKTDATASLEINNGVCAPTSLSMNSNETTALKITNIGTTNATFSIRDIQLSVSDISAGKSKTVALSLGAGQYNFTCYAGEQSSAGTLTVK